MNLIAATTRKFLLAYNTVCKPFCRELGLPQTSFDILMFLGNNPEHNTASDIVEIRNIKANLISVNVDRLVRDGYLTRHAVKGDRRKVELEKDIKDFGSYGATVKLHPGVSASFKVKVEEQA